MHRLADRARLDPAEVEQRGRAVDAAGELDRAGLERVAGVADGARERGLHDGGDAGEQQPDQGGRGEQLRADGEGTTDAHGDDSFGEGRLGEDAGGGIAIAAAGSRGLNPTQLPSRQTAVRPETCGHTPNRR